MLQFCAPMQAISSEQKEVHMPDAPARCDIPDELIRLKQQLPHLVQALKDQRKIKIVAIGSSSTAGEGDVVPYPYRLELALRNRFPDRMIDVLNRGIGGQEAPEELSRFESDVIAEAPTLVIWQVGTNAIYHRDLYDPQRIARTIATGLGWLGVLKTDVILMDLQYAPALLTCQKIDDTKLMVSLISAAADTAKVNLFPQFALMRHWREDDKISFDTMINSADGLHQTDWSTNCVTKALFRAIEQAVAAEVVA
jgi:acyl-CoA thioesterase I